MTADGIFAKFNDAGVQAALTRLAGPVALSLASSMAVAGGQVLRDEAKLLAPEFDGSTALLAGANVDRPPIPGLLRDAIYLAHSDTRSHGALQTYSVSWNSRKAPHGHLLEFGHWRINAIIGGVPTKNRLAAPQWVAAHPFLRPALDIAGGFAMSAMITRGKQRLPQLLAGNTVTANEP
ncbi:MAG TPA: HK97 gp10 family phage protein [Burkholderiales bacterium]|nr:HK97 gp10 family phage protein [Burkholderiales bacterium]HUY04377.1 hypothetical protein [Rhodocyclaceae bacterium]